MQLLSYFFFLYLSVQYSTGNEFCATLESGSVNKITPECMNQLQIMCNDGALWWRLFDASSKYPISGLSYSNNQDLGNYDECVEIDYTSLAGDVKGKYCGLSVAIVNLLLQGIPDPFKLNMNPKVLAQIPKINYTYNLDLRELKVDGTGVVVTTLLSLCVPDKCTPREVGTFFAWAEIIVENIPIVNFVDKVPCMTKDSNTSFEAGDIAFITFLSIIGLLIVGCTAYDFILQKRGQKPKHPVFLAFSILTNGRKLLHISQGANPEQITCLNGIRFISMMWIICGHGFVALKQAPLINYAETREFSDRPIAEYIGSAPIAVDTFFFLSGFLLSFGYLKSQYRLPPLKQILGIPMMILHRYLRLTPALAVVYFAIITIYRLTGSGPLWDYIANFMSKQCTDHWWSFYLYVQNYVNYRDICLNHTWYLSADMQMFILAPLVLIPIAIMVNREQRKPVYIGLSVLIVISVIIPMRIRFADQGIDNDYMTHERFNDYLIGVLFGVLMRDQRFKKFPFSKLNNLIIWCCVLNICVAFNIYYHSIIRVYDHTAFVLFSGLYRPIWSFSLAWMIYSCHRGYGGIVNWFLSWGWFQIGARISYCMYLLHAVVQFYFVGIMRTPQYWGDYNGFYLWCGHFIVTMLVSTVWSLCFESPMIILEKFIFGGFGTKPKKIQAQA